MATWIALAASVLATISVGCSPYGGGTFTCTEDTACGAGGTCSDGFCSFPDTRCDSGLRYGDLSGPLSGQCVGAEMMMPDAGEVPDTPPGQVCYGTGLVMACFEQAPTGAQSFTANTILDTTNNSLCATTSNNVDACVIAAATINVNAGIFVAGRGAKPLVLVATDTITINGLVSVASLRQFNAIGAAANLPGCNAGVAPTATSGGAGGSFGGTGGTGAVTGGGTAGMPGATLSPTTLRGGCAGQPGADVVVPILPGEPGNGGGAVYFIANTAIMVNTGGVVNASGEGGGGGGTSASAGGGGGGSGGFIGFDTPALTIAGSVFANGGGGGEGSGTSSTGLPGADPMTPASAAAGGTGGSNFGTDGGPGSAGSSLIGAPGVATCTTPCTTPNSGGGGGGGAGIIKLYRDTSASGGGAISPPPT